MPPPPGKPMDIREAQVLAEVLAPMILDAIKAEIREAVLEAKGENSRDIKDLRERITTLERDVQQLRLNSAVMWARITMAITGACGAGAVVTWLITHFSQK